MSLMNLAIEKFSAVDTDPGGTLVRFRKYVERMKLMFELVFRKSDGTAYVPTNREKKALMLFRGGNDMQTLYEHVGKVLEADTFIEAVDKIEAALQARTNKVVQRNLLLTRHPQGSKSFERWSVEISNAAKLIDYTNYNWEMAAVDAMILQTSNSKLRERALHDNISTGMMNMGIAKEQSEKGAALLEGDRSQSGSGIHVKEEKVRKVKTSKKKFVKKKQSCTRCGAVAHSQGEQCRADGKICSKCNKPNHFAAVCMSRIRRNDIQRLSDNSESDSEEELVERIIEVKKLNSESITTQVKVRNYSDGKEADKTISLATDTGVRKTILNKTDWDQIKVNCKLVKTSKGFRPYGLSSYRLPIIGRTYVNLTAERGASIKTWVYIVNSDSESSLLGETDAIKLGIVKIDLKGSTEEIRKVEYIQKEIHLEGDIVSGGQTQQEIDETMNQIKSKFKLFLILLESS